MEINAKLKQLLERKKASLVERCGCKEGCQKCGETFELYIKMAMANIPSKYWDYELKDLDQANEAVKVKLEKYCSKLDEVLEKGVGLFLVGANGVGKTLSASLIIKEALKHHYTARFTSLPEILSLSSDGHYNAKARMLYQQELIDVDFLAIDDITKTYKNTEKQTSTYIDIQFDHLFRTRANYNLPTILTSNHTREDALKSADEVLSSSLLSLFAEHLRDITFLGNDRRKDPKQWRLNER